MRTNSRSVRWTYRFALNFATNDWVVAAAAAAMAAAGSAGCGAAGDDDVLVERQRIVYGSDDRQELFEVPSEPMRMLMAESAVALVPRSAVRSDSGRLVFNGPTWGEAGGLCSGEPFAAQPAAAFCSGVLVDWDLVLTAGHCAHLLAPEGFWVVFGYVYDAPGHLATGAADLAVPGAFVADALDPAGAEPRLDYAWIRLDRPVAAPRRPAAVRLSAAPLAAGDSVVAIGAVSGTPLKLDGGGRVREARPDTLDYFIADTDTAHGSSGGGAFDADLALAGVLARGGPDLAQTEEGCNRTVRVSDPAEAEEQYTYVRAAVNGLCRVDPTASSLCRADCGEPCRALPPREAAGCGVAAEGPVSPSAQAPGLVLGLTIGITAAVKYRRRRCPKG